VSAHLSQAEIIFKKTMNRPDNQPVQSEQPMSGISTPAAATPAGSMSKNEQNMGMLCHLLALSGYFVPFGHIVGPLVIWMVKRQEMPYVDSQGKESLNFQISVTLYGILAAISIFLLIGFILLPAVILFSLVCVIIASIETANGKSYRYPLCIRFIH
jgi:hypothetical protein